jgi:hypothetical protein
VDQELAYKENVPLAHALIPNSLVTNAENILHAPKAQKNWARKVNRTFHLHPRGTWTIETLEKVLDVVKKRAFLNEKGQLTLAHILNLFFGSFECQDKIKEGWATRYINR